MSDVPRRRSTSQPERLPSARNRGRSKSRADNAPVAPATPAERDPLGKLIEQHRVTLAGVLVICGLLGAAGAAALWWGWAQQPRTTVALGAMGIGGLMLLMAMVLLFTNLFNVGRSLELRKHGLRWTQQGRTTEFLWKEIAAVEVDRLDSTSVGIATTYRRSDNAVAPSGPLTRTEFSVTIVADDGRKIRLPPSFLQCVGDPKRLISNLKLRSGV